MSQPIHQLPNGIDLPNRHGMNQNAAAFWCGQCRAMAEASAPISAKFPGTVHPPRPNRRGHSHGEHVCGIT
jgi:hypothetical protein